MLDLVLGLEVREEQVPVHLWQSLGQVGFTFPLCHLLAVASLEDMGAGGIFWPSIRRTKLGGLKLLCS